MKPGQPVAEDQGGENPDRQGLLLDYPEEDGDQKQGDENPHQDEVERRIGRQGQHQDADSGAEQEEGQDPRSVDEGDEGRGQEKGGRDQGAGGEFRGTGMNQPHYNPDGQERREGDDIGLH